MGCSADGRSNLCSTNRRMKQTPFLGNGMESRALCNASEPSTQEVDFLIGFGVLVLSTLARS